MQSPDGNDSNGVGISVCAINMAFERRGSRVDVLSDINLDIAPRKFCSILGPSGCGKSTLLMLVAGLYQPSSGRILVNGQTLKGCYSDCGIVFQTDVLLPWLSVLGNVLLPADVKKLPKAAATERARTLLEQVGLNGFETHYPNELSGGMRQRASLCRALLHEPAVMLMDEPFGALDALTRERMQSDLTKLGATDPRTVLFITHDIEEAVFLSDQVVVLSQRPASILRQFDVNFPHPRTSDIRRTQEFHHIVDEIRELFRETGIL
ncbi:MAG: ABC transporter ATP-binding protein [Hyphomicrobiales bacterium]|nr:ABC transporter ATP-binding protein [Hyphomicrobiales bacterium]